MVQAEPWAYLFGALLVLTLPLDWLIAVVLAGLVHEVSHMAAILILGGKVHRLKIRIGAAVMDSEIPGSGRELLCALAGPLGSFLVASLHGMFPKVAVCGFVHGLFNLIPVYPMDGGRALKCLLELTFPGKWHKIWNTLQLIILIMITAGAIYSSFWLNMGLLPVILAGIGWHKTLERKTPCKRRKIRVQ